MGHYLQTEKLRVTYLVKYHNGIVEEKNEITHLHVM